MKIRPDDITPQLPLDYGKQEFLAVFKLKVHSAAPAAVDRAFAYSSFMTLFCEIQRLRTKVSIYNIIIVL